MVRNKRSAVISICAMFALLFGQTLTSLAQERIANRVAVFSGIDKITGRIITFDVYIDETVNFGALYVTPKVCYSRPVTETPKTTGFVEVDEITLDRKIRRIFTVVSKRPRRTWTCIPAFLPGTCWTTTRRNRWPRCRSQK